MKYMGDQVLCLSQQGCTVADETGPPGATKFDCKEAGLENLYGSINVARPPGLRVDKFNPDGSVGARWRRRPLPPVVVGDEALSFENAVLS